MGRQSEHLLYPAWIFLFSKRSHVLLSRDESDLDGLQLSCKLDGCFVLSVYVTLCIFSDPSACDLVSLWPWLVIPCHPSSAFVAPPSPVHTKCLRLSDRSAYSSCMVPTAGVEFLGAKSVPFTFVDRVQLTVTFSCAWSSCQGGRHTQEMSGSFLFPNSFSEMEFILDYMHQLKFTTDFQQT